MDIISYLKKEAEHISETDLSWIVADLSQHYQHRIDNHAVRVYGNSNIVSRDAFRETAKATLFNGLNTFLFKREHWRAGRDVNSYLLMCLKRLADQFFWDQSSAKRATVLICPGCRELGVKVCLVSESKLWRCSNCTSEIDRLQDDVKGGKLSTEESVSVRARIRIHKSFTLHTRRGFRCPEPSCSRFIPESLNGKFGIECPYSDCDFFGQAESLDQMTHPSMLATRQTFSLNQPINSSESFGSNTICLQDTFAAETIGADDKISINESFVKEYRILLEVIDSQIENVKRTNNNSTRIQKLLMYKSFRLMCEKHPDEMVSYLVHQKQSADSPIQARIFQQYVRLIENELPFTIERRGEKIEIFSISDAELDLFSGSSTFDAFVNGNGKIPNNTIETYAGLREYKMYGPCFLGLITSIINKKTGESVLDKVKSHTFVDIDIDLPSGTEVTVTHYRIPSHYELKGLVALQRIRKSIVDKVYFRLNGVKRKPGTKPDNQIL